MGFIKDEDVLAVTSTMYDDKDPLLDAVPKGWDSVTTTSS